MKLFYAKNREEWRRRLSENHAKEKEIWLVYYRKASGKPRIPYNDAVEEALCFGWIDSQQKGVDDERIAQRFSPRRPNSSWSELNKVRLRRLVAKGRMTRAGMAVAQKASLDTPLVILPPHIEEELKKDSLVWQNFQKFPEDYKRIRIAYIESRRRHGEDAYERALEHFIRKTRKNRMYGNMINFI